MPRIIGLLGNKGSGKDTAGSYLVEKYGYKRYAFADPIKEISRHLFSLSEEQLSGSLKEEKDNRWGLKPRTIFQRLGTEFGQYKIYNIFPELKRHIPSRQIWTYNFELWLQKNRENNIVITDVRFKHEVDVVKKYGGEIIKITRNNLETIDKHISEDGIKDIAYDDEILNNKDKEHLYKHIDIVANTPF